MTATAAPEPVMDLRAYKFRLDPNIAQTQALSQAAGAARVAYNMVIAHNRAAHDEGRRRMEELTASGVDPEAAAARVRAQRTTDPALTMVFTKMGFNAILTAERRRHQAAAEAITAGADPAQVWVGQSYERPWLHDANRRVMVSGVEHATAAFTNWVNSYTGQRAGRRVGYPRFKKKHASQDSFTIPAPGAHGWQRRALQAGGGPQGSEHRLPAPAPGLPGHHPHPPAHPPPGASVSAWGGDALFHGLACRGPVVCPDPGGNPT